VPTKQKKRCTAAVQKVNHSKSAYKTTAYKTKKTLYCGGAKSKPLKKCLQNYCLQNNFGVVNVS